MNLKNGLIVLLNLGVSKWQIQKIVGIDNKSFLMKLACITYKKNPEQDQVYNQNKNKNFF